MHFVSRRHIARSSRSRGHIESNPWLRRGKLALQRSVQTASAGDAKQLASVESKLNIHQPSDWYSVSASRLAEAGGEALLKAHGGLVSEVLTALVPSHSWLPWKFSPATRDWWSDTKNQRTFVDWLRKEMKLERWEDLYGLRFATFELAGGARLLKLHGDSPAGVVMAVYPEHRWLPWRFAVTPRSWWAQPAHQREFMEYLRKELNLDTMEALYTLTKQQIEDHGGVGLLNHYGRTASAAVAGVYPDHTWQMWRFETAPLGWWRERENQLAFLAHLADQLNIQQPEGWYNVTMEQIDSHGGSALRALYNHSPSAMVEALVPSHKFLPWKFVAVKKHFWEKRECRHQFLEWIREHLRYSSLEDFYRLNITTIAENGGAGLIARFHGSTQAIVTDAYPNHPWLPWRFLQTPRKWWADKRNQLRFVEWLRGQLDLKTMEDLYSLTSFDVIKFAGRSLLRQAQGALPDVIQSLYPQHKWQRSKFQAQRQTLISKLLSCAYPSFQIKEEVRRDTANTDYSTMEVDLFIEELKAAVEYQGEQHYFDLNIYGQATYFLDKDINKALSCATGGVSYVEIPFWANLESLDAVHLTFAKLSQPT